MYIADTLSCDCDNNVPSGEEDFEVLAFLAISEQATVHMRRVIDQDDSLKLLREVVKNGWPDNQEKVPTALKPY